MFSGILEQTIIAVLAMLAAGGIAWVFLYPLLSGEAEATKRLDRISEGRRVAGAGKASATETALRRKSVEISLKELEVKQGIASKNPPLAIRLEQAGLNWDRKTFFMVSALAGLMAYAFSMSLSPNMIVAVGAGICGGIGFPRWYLDYARKRRVFKFLDEFPNALDVITRGVKAGLPLVDCIRICANESAEPVRSEFKLIMEAQALNVSISDAVIMLYERIPVAETSFFSIVITVQQKSGGNLSEILTNLSKVLRDRKKMKNKARALAQEAVASAAIIGSLPPLVGFMIYIMNAEYISLLWTTSLGHMLLIGGGLWMAAGIFVMKKMINIDV